jgi:hypothetical protein
MKKVWGELEETIGVIDQQLLDAIGDVSLNFINEDYIVEHYSGDAYDEMTRRFAEKNPRLSDPNYTFDLLVGRNPIYKRMYEKMRLTAEIKACWEAFESYCGRIEYALKEHKESMLCIYNPFAQENSGYGFLDDYEVE